MIRLKTAVLLAASLKIGAICGGARDKDADLLYDVGINLGLAFQLQDDYLDAFSDPDVFGKETGGDIVANKKTYLLLRTLEKANDEDSNLLYSWLEKQEFDRDEKISVILGITKKYGVDAEIRQKIADYSDIALGKLNEITGDNEQKEELRLLILSLINRIK